MSVGERIKELRKALGYTQKELAEKSGVATVSIQQYERGVRQPRIDQLNKIATVFQTPLSTFVDVEPVMVQIVDSKCVSKEQQAKWDAENNNFCNLIEYLKTIGYDLGYEVADCGEELYYSLRDLNANKLYILSADEVSLLGDSVRRYSEFLLQDILKGKPSLDATTTPQPSPAPQDGTDTTPPADAPETSPEGE